MSAANKKTIDVVIVNFDEPEQGLPKLTEGTSDVTCETTQKFYEALKEKGLIT